MFEHLKAWKEQRELKGETTSLGEAIHQQLREEESKEKQGNPVQAIDEQLEQLKPKIAHYKRLIDKGFGLPDEELAEYGTKLAELYKAQKSLEDAKKAIKAKAEEMAEGKQLLDETLEKWNAFSLEAKRRVVKLVVESVIITKTAPGWIKIEIIWKGIGLPTADIGYLRLPTSPNSDWSPEEIKVLEEMYPYADSDDILEKLPNRAWRPIIGKASRLRIKRYANKPPTDPLLLHLPLDDLKFLEENNIDPHAIKGGQILWSDREVFLPIQTEDIIEDDYSQVSTCNDDGSLSSDTYPAPP